MLAGCLSCCCGTNTTSDDEDVIDDNERANLIRNGVVNNRYGSGASTPVGPSSGGSGSGVLSGRKITPADEEQQILQRILVQTQSNIIDVSALDQANAGPEFMNRLAKYEQLIRRAEPRHKGARHSQGRSLVCDCGGQVTDVLSRGPMSVEDFSWLRNLATSAEQAMQSGLRVEHQEDLVVHMDPN